MFLIWDYYKYHFCEHPWTHFCCTHVHISVGYIPRTWELDHIVCICLALEDIVSFPMDQDFGSRLAGWCRPRVSCGWHQNASRDHSHLTLVKDPVPKWLTRIITVNRRPQLLTVKLLEYLSLLTCPRGNWSKRVSSPFNFSHSSRCVLMYCAFSFHFLDD